MLHNVNEIELKRSIQETYQVLIEWHSNTMESEIDYQTHNCVTIDEMDSEWEYCHEFKFNKESMGLCCASVKVNFA